MESIPPPYRSVFAKFQFFNKIQEEILLDCFATGENVVVSAPTGSGKTVAFELAVIRLIEQSKHDLNFAAVYLAPLKALCKEKYLHWNTVFSPFNIKVVEISGDTDLPDLGNFRVPQLILTTPEKWDLLTRKWNDYAEFRTSLKLVMIDEVHLLNESRRGATLEAVICRMKLMSSGIRYLAISATILNAYDIGKWLGPATRVHQFSDLHRPIQLERHVLGYPIYNTFSNFQFDAHLTYKLEGILSQFSSFKPSLIFCSTRRGVEMTAQHLLKVSKSVVQGAQLMAIENVTHQLVEKKLSAMIQKGIGYHHAGLSLGDRNIIENLFRSGNLSVLVCTNTLAMGVNLPAYLVVIRSTTTYGFRDNSPTESPNEYSTIDILQMMGRAGRPGFDTKGVAVIMTQSENVEKYRNLVNGTRAIESNLDRYLVEHLNAEIVLETIRNIGDAIKWLRATFFYVRAIRNPLALESVEGGAAATSANIEKCLQNMCSSAFNTLEENHLITKRETFEEDFPICPTPFGRLMSRYFISIESMRMFHSQINGSESLGELLDIVCHLNEFQEFKVRASDRKVLNALSQGGGGAHVKRKSKGKGFAAAKASMAKVSLADNQVAAPLLRFPLGKISSVPMKISCLLQAQLGNVTRDDAAAGLGQETTKIYNLAVRLVKCLYEYVKIKASDGAEPYFGVLVSALTLMKCLDVRMWEEETLPMMFRQLPKIGIESVRKLANAGVANFDELLVTDPRVIEKILNRSPPFGDDIHAMIHRLPTYFISMQQQRQRHPSYDDGDSAGDELPANEDGVSIKVNVKQLNRDYEHNLNDEISLIIGDVQTNQLLFHKDKLQTAFKATNSVEFQLAVDGSVSALVAHLIHHSIVGLDQSKVLTVNAKPQPVRQKAVVGAAVEKMEIRSMDNGAIIDGDRGSCRPGEIDGPEGKKKREADDFQFIPPKKIMKGNADGFTVDDVFPHVFQGDGGGEKLNSSSTMCYQEMDESQTIQSSNETPVDKGPLLSLIEARDLFKGPEPKQTTFEAVMGRITGKPYQTPSRTSSSLKQILSKTTLPERRLHEPKVARFENLKIFFE